jgi:NhaP-type Na+/H+ or K+/H+ antiporter
MSITIIIIVCILLLISYVFDLTAHKTKIPSVILLLILGYLSRQIANGLGVDVPDLSAFLTIFGTIGLILIVLEGAIDLELNRSKLPVIGKSALIAFLPMIIMGVSLAFIFKLFNDASYSVNLLNVIPLCVISSAIAIPSVKHLCKKNKEFIVYESSLSDIIGVLFFTFLLTTETINLSAFGNFGGQIMLMFVISFVATILLVFLLSKITGHVKFAPIIILIILIYAIAEESHLPALIFIFIFGLFLGNISKIEKIPFVKKMQPGALYQEVDKFSELIKEGAFLIRSMFFLIFGFLIETAELLNGETLLFALLIVAVIFGLRFVILKLLKLSIDPLLYAAPRGLITILLFLSIPVTQAIPQVNKSLIIQVIVLTALILMIGLMTSKGDKIKTSAEVPDGELNNDEVLGNEQSIVEEPEVVEIEPDEFQTPPRQQEPSDRFDD